MLVDAFLNGYFIYVSLHTSAAPRLAAKLSLPGCQGQIGPAARSSEVQATGGLLHSSGCYLCLHGSHAHWSDVSP